MPVSPMLPKLVGARVKRREDPRLIQGHGSETLPLQELRPAFLARRISDDRKDDDLRSLLRRTARFLPSALNRLQSMLGPEALSVEDSPANRRSSAASSVTATGLPPAAEIVSS